MKRIKRLKEDEIQFLEGLYERYEVRLGKHGFKPQRGVMQGSPIAPFLFNIYIEELLEMLETKHGLNIEEILAYADDIAVICYSMNLLNQVISTIREWSDKNGLQINSKKRGLLQICPCQHQRSQPSQF